MHSLDPPPSFLVMIEYVLIKWKQDYPPPPPLLYGVKGRVLNLIFVQRFAFEVWRIRHFCTDKFVSDLIQRLVVVGPIHCALIGAAMRGGDKSEGAATRGNKTKAARLLRLSPPTLYYRLEKYGL